ncbi:hypothetical protein F4805DRAFT_41554 [Annulohypoxylon moriforme]|nr:hypothetical protein F4805DRAFT_41554 [Annulohypoxylon moriforme]
MICLNFFFPRSSTRQGLRYRCREHVHQIRVIIYMHSASACLCLAKTLFERTASLPLSASLSLYLPVSTYVCTSDNAACLCICPVSEKGVRACVCRTHNGAIRVTTPFVSCLAPNGVPATMYVCVYAYVDYIFICRSGFGSEGRPHGKAPSPALRV